MERDFNFDKDSWICPKCGTNASKYFCGNCGFKIYAGFGLRFISLLIDYMIASTFTKLIMAAGNNSIGNLVGAVVLSLCFLVFYHVFLVGKCGQTPGKMITRIKIVRLDGAKIRWLDAWLRYSVEIFFFICTVLVATLIGLKTSMGTTLDSIDPDTLGLRWVFIIYSLLHILLIVYAWSEVIVLLTNEKRRAIHDFIAGTVIVHDPRLSRIPQDSKG